MRKETELFKDKIEVSLDGKQVFYLFFGGAVIVSLVFVLGVMVGKRVEARTHASHPSEASAAADPLAALDQLSKREGRSFRSALIEGEANPRYDVDIALAAKDGQRAPSAKASSAQVKASAKPSSPEKSAQPAGATPTPSDKSTPVTETKPSPEKPKQAPPVEQPTVAASKPKPKKKKKAKFTLQLSSFRDRVEADSFFDKLESSGYVPYIVEADVPNKGIWYRVRLGAYESYEAAISAKQEFERKQHIIAYVTRL